MNRDLHAAAFAAVIAVGLGMSAVYTGSSLGWLGMTLWAFVASLYLARGLKP